MPSRKTGLKCTQENFPSHNLKRCLHLKLMLFLLVKVCAECQKNDLRTLVNHFSKIKANKGHPETALSNFNPSQVQTYVDFSF